LRCALRGIALAARSADGSAPRRLRHPSWRQELADESGEGLRIDATDLVIPGDDQGAVGATALVVGENIRRSIRSQLLLPTRSVIRVVRQAEVLPVVPLTRIVINDGEVGALRLAVEKGQGRLVFVANAAPGEDEIGDEYLGLR